MAIKKGVTRLLALPRQVPLLPKPKTVWWTYVMSQKEATIHGMVATGILFLNPKSFCILFDLGATHLFIKSQIAWQLNLENDKI